MGQEYRGRVFKSGNSVALRLPKALGLAEGTEVRIVDQGRGSLLVETSPSRQKIDVDSFWGSVPGIALPEDHDRTFADRPSASAADDS